MDVSRRAILGAAGFAAVTLLGAGRKHHRRSVTVSAAPVLGGLTVGHQDVLIQSVSRFPDAANTGPTGTLTVQSGDITVNTAGTVLQNLEIDGQVTIAAGANNVTIRNCLIKSGGTGWLVDTHYGATGLVITDCELDALNSDANDAAVGGDNYSITRCNIHGTTDGLKVGYATSVQDCYIHDLHATATSHNDGIQSLGTIGLTIQHNTIFNAGDGTAIILSTGSAIDMRNILITNNLLAGGGFTVYGGYSAGQDDPSKVSNISITNNKFSTIFYPNSGWAGPLTNADPPVVHTGNTWYDGPNAGQAID